MYWDSALAIHFVDVGPLLLRPLNVVQEAAATRVEVPRHEHAGYIEEQETPERGLRSTGYRDRSAVGFRYEKGAVRRDRRRETDDCS